RVMWLGLSEGAAEVSAVQQQIAIRLESVGISRESRPFHPHLTLARWRTSTPADRRPILAAAVSQNVGRGEVAAGTLIHSQLSSAGPTYTPLCQARLRDHAGIPLQSSR